MSSHNNGRAGLAIAMMAGLSLFGAGCAAPAATSAAASSNSPISSESVREPLAGLEDLDLGGDWIAAAASGTATGAGTRPTETMPIALGGSARTSYWSVLLRTFAGEEHRGSAATMIRSLASIDPKLASAHARTTPRGSMVLWGLFDDADNADAQRGLSWIKDVEIRGQKVFPRAMLTRVRLTGSQVSYQPHELMSVRKRYPDVDPLYSLQIAVWGDFGSSAYPPDRRRRDSVAYVGQLRGDRVEAYVHHDEEKGMSMVTVGLFDRTAIDGQSGIFAPEVERLMKKFPQHLVNGQPLNEPIDARRPDRGTRVQAPRLVLVPR